MTTKTLRMPRAWAASRSPWTRSRLRPRVGKCRTVSTPTWRWTRSQTAQGLMRMRAMGLSATLITSAPASASRLAPASSLWVERPRGGSISTATTNCPAASFWASGDGSSGESALLVGSPPAWPARAMLGPQPRGGGIQGGAHGGDVRGGGAAAAADQAGAGFAKGQGILAKIIGVGRVHDAPADLLGPAGVGHDREDGRRGRPPGASGAGCARSGPGRRSS